MPDPEPTQHASMPAPPALSLLAVSLSNPVERAPATSALFGQESPAL